MINTTLGPMNEDDLEITYTDEVVPCGVAKTTTYKTLDTGEMVRQDIEIKVTQPLEATGHAGFFQRLKQAIHDWTKV